MVIYNHFCNHMILLNYSRKKRLTGNTWLVYEPHFTGLLTRPEPSTTVRGK
jgi:hypothetical protein